MKSGTHVLLRGFSPSRFCSPSPPLQDPSWACGSLTTLPPVVDPARYRLTSIDIVHVALSAAVFRVVAARDKNVVGCFYGPSPAKETARQRCSTSCRSALACSAACSLPFITFPTRRHDNTRHQQPQLTNTRSIL
jgi:hypothetical protein